MGAKKVQTVENYSVESADDFTQIYRWETGDFIALKCLKIYGNNGILFKERFGWLNFVRWW